MSRHHKDFKGRRSSSDSHSRAPRPSDAHFPRKRHHRPEEEAPRFEIVFEGRLGPAGLLVHVENSRRRIAAMLAGTEAPPPTLHITSPQGSQASFAAAPAAPSPVPQGGGLLGALLSGLPSHMQPRFAPSRSYLPSGRSNAPELRPTPPKSEAPQPSSAATSPQETPLASPSKVSLDPWQQEALDHLKNGLHVIVDAPTSAGKTRVIEALLDEKLKEGIKLIYTSPVKSLSNDKYREFSERFGKDLVGINTGDFKENLGAPIILATLETYRNSLLGIEPNMSRRVVVYDEYHYLQDEGRGSAWEESIILTPKGSQLILLSASVPNASEFSEWIGGLTGVEAKVVTVSQRPVPLVDLIWTPKGWILADELKLTPTELADLKRLAGRNRRNRFRGKAAYQAIVEPIQSALEQGLGPVVLYAGRRGDVEGLAQTMARFLKQRLRGEEAWKLEERLKTLQGWEYVPSELQKLIRTFGIAWHHSGMIPPGRVAIETLLKEGLLKICTGTMGISLGVNFAVRSAFVFDESRPSEGGDTLYAGSEVMQMLGRAGRRGHDTQGFSLWANAGRFAVQKPNGREPCRSSLKFDPTTVLGILGQKENLAYLSEFYRKSFFLRGKDPSMVFLKDHDLIAGHLYKEYGTEPPCEDIPSTWQHHLEGKRRSGDPCLPCPLRTKCHPLVSAAQKSVLTKIVGHLEKVGAIRKGSPTRMGQIARMFPQAGGLIIAKWIASGEMHGQNFRLYVEALAAFSTGHYKEIPDTHRTPGFVESLKIEKAIEHYYPIDLFPELYDVEKGEEEKVNFREFNPNAGSIVKMWLNPRTDWESLTENHVSKYFSEGDCMNVLFRFATFLQSCARLEEIDPEIARQAVEMRNTLLREPLDARNRMLLEDTEAEDIAEAHSSPAEPVNEGAADTSE